MKGKKRKGVFRIGVRILLGLLLLYVSAGLLPCMILPAYPETGPEDWPASDMDADTAMLVESGEQSLNIRLGMIRPAEEHIRLGTYLFGVDTSGTEVMAALYQAAERGVQVDILTDGILGVFNFHDDPLVYALGSHENVTIYLYNPVDLLKPWNLNGRYHEKFMVADNRYALLGGRNVADEFLKENTEGYSIDLEVLTRKTGSGISACDLLAERFDDMISSPYCRTAYEADKGERTARARETLRSYPVRRGTDLSGLSLVPVRKTVVFM